MFEDIRKRRGVLPIGNLENTVNRVVVILTSSRGGSSLFKQVLTRHPAIAALSGEMEPFLVLSRNSFPHAADSDALTSLMDKERLLADIFDDLTVASSTPCDTPTVIERWRKRVLLQFPAVFSDFKRYSALLLALEWASHLLRQTSGLTEDEIYQLILGEIFHAEPWRINFYDGYHHPMAAPAFDEPIKIEEPPFVTPPLQRRAWRPSDAKDTMLLFKTPQDCYRIGIYEQLFPQAQITYLHLTRGFAQTVNGLIDGWCLPTGFFAHNLQPTGVMLAMPGYSETYSFGLKWWKFDLPPNWRDFTQAPLHEVCLNQWLSAHRAILESGVTAERIHFEEFLRDPTAVARRVYKILDLPEFEVSPELPVVMASSPPRQYRWHDRADLIAPLIERPEIRGMMMALGYSIDPKTWT